jgi:hypothetical protein
MTLLPAQKILVDQLLDWSLVKKRLNQYPSIATAFPIETLQALSERPPYYCHYMSLRLGVFCGEESFALLDSLLAIAMKIENWEGNKNLLTQPEYGAYYSLLWQLQVAEYLLRMGCKPKWNCSGPDLSVLTEKGEPFHVECYVYRKTVDAFQYVEDLCAALCKDLVACRPYALQGRLPTGDSKKLTDWLSNLLQPLTNAEKLSAAAEQAKHVTRVVLNKCDKTQIAIHMNGNTNGEYVPQDGSSAVGDGELWLKVALQEVLNAKSDSNNLKRYKPNIVAVCFLQTAEYINSLGFVEHIGANPYESLVMPADIDAVMHTDIDIKKKLSSSNLRMLLRTGSIHPAQSLADTIEFASNH